MILTTTVTFVPTDTLQAPSPVTTPPGARGALTYVMTLAASPISPDGTYLVIVETDVPVAQTLSIPVPTFTRLKSYANATADLGTIVQPEDPRIFHPLTTFCPRMLQTIKNVVIKAIEDTAP